MLSRRVAPFLLALLLVGLAVSSPRLGRDGSPSGEEVTTTLAALSLAHDHDLRFEAADLARGNRLWAEGPVGVRLASRPGENLQRFAVPVAAALALAPCAAAFGVTGLPVLNALLLALLAGWAWRLRPGSGWGPVFFLASGALALVFRAEPHVLGLTLVFAALALGGDALATASPSPDRPLWGVVAGGLVAAATSIVPLAAWSGLFLVVERFRRRQFRAAAALLVGMILAAGVLALAQHRVAASWWPSAATAQEWSGPFPGESGARGQAVAGESWGIDRIDARPAWAGRALLDRLLGRHEGLLPFFPLAAFAVVLGWRGADWRRRVALAAIVAAIGLRALARGGPPVTPAYAWFLPLLPLAFVALPERVGSRAGALLAVALGLWTVPAVGATWAAGERGDVASAASLPTFGALPLELTGLADPVTQPELARQVWGDVLWIVPRASFFLEERHPHGVWVRGGSRSDIVLASPRPLDRLTLRLYSLAGPNPVTLESPAGSVTAPFASGSELAVGVDVALPLRSAAHDLGVVLPPGPEWIYRVALRVAEGRVPRRQRPRGDGRDLGVFLSVDGQPP